MYIMEGVMLILFCVDTKYATPPNLANVS